MTRSKSPMNTAKASENTTTTVVEFTRSSRVGQFTRPNSALTSAKKVVIFSSIDVCFRPSKSGRPGRTRTCNPRFWRPVLYQIELQT